MSLANLSNIYENDALSPQSLQEIKTEKDYFLAHPILQRLMQEDWANLRPVWGWIVNPVS